MNERKGYNEGKRLENSCIKLCHGRVDAVTRAAKGQEGGKKKEISSRRNETIRRNQHNHWPKQTPRIYLTNMFNGLLVA